MATDYKNDDEQRKIDISYNPLERKYTNNNLVFFFCLYSLLLRGEIR